MNISQSALAWLYWYAFLLGVGLGAIYDALRITRVFLGVHYSRWAAKRLEQIRLPLLRPHARRRESRLLGVAIFFEDLLFCILSGCAIILLFYEMNNGKIRFPAFFCVATGFFLYRATLGRVAMLCSEVIAFVIETAVRYACFFLSWPFRMASRRIAKWTHCAMEKGRMAYHRRMRRRWTADQLRRASRDACGMIPDEILEQGIKKRRGRHVSRKQKAIQPDAAGAHTDCRFGGGVPGGVRK